MSNIVQMLAPARLSLSAVAQAKWFEARSASCFAYSDGGGDMMVPPPALAQGLPAT